jgi:predicted histidine transporter YuiF (NhaC family)
MRDQAQYEKKQQEIKAECAKKKRVVKIIMAAVTVAAAALFVVGLKLDMEHIAVYAIAALIIITFTAKMGVSRLGAIMAYQKHQMELLESEEPFGQFQLKGQ